MLLQLDLVKSLHGILPRFLMNGPPVQEHKLDKQKPISLGCPLSKKNRKYRCPQPWPAGRKAPGLTLKDAAGWFSVTLHMAKGFSNFLFVS
jgi:hypothetical protein